MVRCQSLKDGAGWKLKRLPRTDHPARERSRDAVLRSGSARRVAAEDHPPRGLHLELDAMEIRSLVPLGLMHVEVARCGAGGRDTSVGGRWQQSRRRATARADAHSSCQGSEMPLRSAYRAVNDLLLKRCCTSNYPPPKRFPGTSRRCPGGSSGPSPRAVR